MRRALALVFQRDMRAIHARLTASADLAETARWPVAFATGGDGAPVLAFDSGGHLLPRHHATVRQWVAAFWDTLAALQEPATPENIEGQAP